MSPSEHLDWFEDNVNWFASIPVEQYSIAVPSCPGWHIEKVVNHLAIGLGLAYPFALRAPADSTAETAWGQVEWPRVEPAGAEAHDYFVSTMTSCLRTYRSTDPDLACWAYSGPGVASFWFRRAAIETTLHRFDVAEALGSEDKPLAEDRGIDAVAEAIEFALPMAASMVDNPAGAVEVHPDESADPFLLGEGTPRAEISGPSEDILAALWGRTRDRVVVTGAADVANQWLSLVESAFAGR